MSTAEIAKAFDNLVYVRPITGKELQAVPGVVEQFDPDTVFFSVHNPDGERLAVLTDRDAAFQAARAHELSPVWVH